MVLLWAVALHSAKSRGRLRGRLILDHYAAVPLPGGSDLGVDAVVNFLCHEDALLQRDGLVDRVWAKLQCFELGKGVAHDAIKCIH